MLIEKSKQVLEKGESWLKLLQSPRGCLAYLATLLAGVAVVLVAAGLVAVLFFTAEVSIQISGPQVSVSNTTLIEEG